jgi:hypothetical protein
MVFGGSQVKYDAHCPIQIHFIAAIKKLDRGGNDLYCCYDDHTCVLIDMNLMKY